MQRVAQHVVGQADEVDEAALLAAPRRSHRVSKFPHLREEGHAG